MKRRDHGDLALKFWLAIGIVSLVAVMVILVLCSISSPPM